ncbi:hypothetical protein CDG81_11445 [Actinopolyspora erythraea]|uniref:Class I SAM-dependent methyltransferase n=2 Tax=Actinopolyspora erythraea TaxID=414996 RepID=A0A099D857_9ACTN|nr:hypothetical protein CDG81_11445 [Actinopolyspora erythraea]KGI81545.1 hypothetical protein IL38_11515 [Actinopolyspora erythraea]
MVRDDVVMRLSLPRPSADSISPTAHYTGHVWARNGLGGHEFSTDRGRLYYEVLRPFMAVSRKLGGPVLEDVLLARHRLLDHLLEEEMATGRVNQVIELASGLSPRGHEFSRRHGSSITYVETDLPDMAERKRNILREVGSLGRHHRVEALDVVGGDGLDELRRMAGTLDPADGLAVVSEGLLNYLPIGAVRGLWAGLGGLLNRFEYGIYLSDLHVAADNRGVLNTVGAKLLGAFVRSGTHFHFTWADEAAAALRASGFGIVEPHSPSEFAGRVADTERPHADLVRIMAASPGTK